MQIVSMFCYESQLYQTGWMLHESLCLGAWLWWHWLLSTHCPAPGSATSLGPTFSGLTAGELWLVDPSRLALWLVEAESWCRCSEWRHVVTLRLASVVCVIVLNACKHCKHSWLRPEKICFKTLNSLFNIRLFSNKPLLGRKMNSCYNRINMLQTNLCRHFLPIRNAHVLIT